MIERNSVQLLYVAPTAEECKVQIDLLAQVQGCHYLHNNGTTELLYNDTRIQWWYASDPEQARFLLRNHHLNLVLLDCRTQPAVGLRFLDVLDSEDVELRYGFHRIVALIGKGNHEDNDRLIIELGARGVRHVLRDDASDEGDAAFTKNLLDRALRVLVKRKRGKRALCVSGGGITGFYFELGALKCLLDCLPKGALQEFDMFYGISAGAIVTGLLAQGYSVEEIMAAIAGHKGGRIKPFSLSLARFQHIHRDEIGRRARVAAKSLLEHAWRAVRLRSRPNLQALFFEYGDIIGAPFRTARYEEMLREMFTGPGLTNDFRELAREFHVGVSDQDARTHVMFGPNSDPQVPISKAIQASSSIMPAFSSVEINGRWYEDGAVTKTSNFGEAVRNGADLIFVLDPLLPFVSKEAGFGAKRGILYSVDQALRTILYTRYNNARRTLLRRHPEVSLYSFLPSNRTRRVLSVNPMDHRPYLEIWRGAYLSTLKRIKQLGPKFAGDLKGHGLSVDTSKAEVVAAQLRELTKPRFADFFPNGQIDIDMPPLGRLKPEGDDWPDAPTEVAHQAA